MLRCPANLSEFHFFPHCFIDSGNSLMLSWQPTFEASRTIVPLAAAQGSALCWTQAVCYKR